MVNGVYAITFIPTLFNPTLKRKSYAVTFSKFFLLHGLPLCFLCVINLTSLKHFLSLPLRPLPLCFLCVSNLTSLKHFLSLPLRSLPLCFLCVINLASLNHFHFYPSSLCALCPFASFAYQTLFLKTPSTLPPFSIQPSPPLNFPSFPLPNSTKNP